MEKLLNRLFEYQDFEHNSRIDEMMADTESRLGLAALDDDVLAMVAGGADTDSLRYRGKDVPLPLARSKKPEDGGYDGGIYPITTEAPVKE